MPFLQALSALWGAPSASPSILTEPAAVAPFATDWRKRFSGKPLAVVFPATTQQVASLVKLAAAHRVALVPQGGNTGLSGGATPDASGQQVIVCLSRMKAIRSQDPVNKTITVEAGLSLQAVQEAASAMGLLFPLSLGSEGSATIGGNLATNAGGTAVLRYGNSRDLCLGLEVVTANGEIWNGLRALRKDNTGYDLRDLFIGSEGTLGIITAAVLKLFPLPASRATAWVSVQDPAQALALLQDAQASFDSALTAFEYMSAQSLSLLDQYFPNLTQGLKASAGADQVDSGGNPNGVLAGLSGDRVLIEISHAEPEPAASDMMSRFLESGLGKGLLTDAVLAQSGVQANTLWQMRERITLASAEDGPQVKHDIAVPISDLPTFIRAMDAELMQAYPGVRIINFGHFGDGNLHYNIAAPQAIAQGLAVADRQARFARYIDQHEDEIRRRVHDRVLRLNGSISAEHGLGQLRRDEALRAKSEVELNLMRAIKQALDPQGILNPGKVLPKLPA